jgi:hypothetical protein
MPAPARRQGSRGTSEETPYSPQARTPRIADGSVRPRRRPALRAALRGSSDRPDSLLGRATRAFRFGTRAATPAAAARLSLSHGVATRWGRATRPSISLASFVPSCKQSESGRWLLAGGDRPLQCASTMRGWTPRSARRRRPASNRPTAIGMDDREQSLGTLA